MQKWQAHPKSVWSLAFSPDGARLATACHGEAALFDPTDGIRERRFQADTGQYSSVAFSPDSSLLAVAHGHDVNFHELATGTQLFGLNLGVTLDPSVPLVGFQSVAFRPDGGALVAGGSGMLHLFSLNPRELYPSSWSLGGGNTLYVVFSPDGTELATPADGGRLLLWDAYTREARGLLTRGRLLPGRPALHGPAYSPDGSVLAIGAAGGEIHLWDRMSQTVQGILAGHTGEVLQVAWHPSGDLLMSGGFDGTVRFWEPRAGRQIACFAWEIGRTHRVAFAPDGLTAVAAGHTGWVVRWDVA